MTNELKSLLSRLKLQLMIEAPDMKQREKKKLLSKLIEEIKEILEE